MELKIATAELSRALGRSQGIVEKKSTMPILSHVLLEAKKGQLVVSATDLDLAVSSEHEKDCEILKEGSVAVSARPALPCTDWTSGKPMMMRSCATSARRASSMAMPGNVVGMYSRLPSHKGGMNSEPSFS